MRKLCKERKRKQSDGRSRSFFCRLNGARGPRSLDNQGLTLIEVIVSVAIFSIVAFPLITQLNTLMRGNYTAKVSQAETDLATRVMEQFKQADPNIILSSDGTGAANQWEGYTVGTDMVTGSSKYEKKDIVIGKDIDTGVSGDTGYSPVRSNTKYNVEVLLDADKYSSGNGTLITDNSGKVLYDDINDTKYYNLDNIDNNFSVILNADSSNYDTTATQDLTDKLAEQLKDNNPVRYNQWRRGVNILGSIRYNKYLYITVNRASTYDSVKADGKPVYEVTARLTYVVDTSTSNVSLGLNGAGKLAVSYTLVNEQKIYSSQTGGRLPSIYVLYNQYVQGANKIESGRDSIIIDNSGVAGDMTDTNPLKVYIVRSNAADNGKYEYYERKESAGDETYYNSVGSESHTENTVGSRVYEVPQAYDNKTYYLYPSIMISSGDADYQRIKSSLMPGSAAVSSIDASKSASGNAVQRYEYYTNVYSELAPSDLFHDTSLYSQGEGRGYYGYRAREISGKDYFVDRNGGTEKNMYPGDIVYQRSAHEYVYPDGTVTNQIPDLKFYDITTPSKVDYKQRIALNVVAADQSVTDEKRFKIFTNLSSYSNQIISSNSAGTGEPNMPNPIVDAGDVTSGINNNYKTVTAKTLDNFNPLSGDADLNKPKRMYHVTVNLYRVVDSGTPKKVLTLESGKEG